MSRVVGPGRNHPAESNTPLVSADVSQWDDDSGEGWWAGAQQCFVGVAAALVIAGSAQASQLAQQITTQDQDELWTSTSQGGSGTVLPVFIESSLGKYFQPWEFEQHDRASPPLDESPYVPPAPWPATTSSPFWDTHDWPEPPAPPTEIVESDPWPLPAPWPATTAPVFFEEYFAPLPPPPELRVTEDQYFPPKPWGQGYVLLPMSGSGSRVDQFQVGAIQVTEDESLPPAPWPVPPRPLYWFAQDEWPTPAPPLQVASDDWIPTVPRGGDPNVMLYLVDEAPPFPIDDDGWFPPVPEFVRFQRLYLWAIDDRPEPAAALQVDVDPWPLPAAWPATAHRALVWPQDEQPTFVEPTMVEPDPWPLPRPWFVPTQGLVLWTQDEISSVAALGQDTVEPVVLVWPERVAPQPILGEDERPEAAPITWETDELFPKVTVERIWVVPQPWEFEQHLIAFLSPHIPVKIRDVSGPRYGLENVTGKRYVIRDESATRYEVEEQ